MEHAKESGKAKLNSDYENIKYTPKEQHSLPLSMKEV